jgi:carbonic anhydrase
MCEPLMSQPSRRVFLRQALAAGAALALPLPPALARSTAPLVTPDQALHLLKEGNARFLAERPLHPNMTIGRLRETFAEGQHPFATILGCSDSRVPVELIFDRGIGDIFSVRVAGNVASHDEIASIEYGVEHRHAPLLVVLGHTHCGAVKHILDGEKMDIHVQILLDNIVPAAMRAKARGLTGEALWNSAVRENVLQSMADCRRRSVPLRDLERAGRVRIVGAVYHTESGVVEWI